MAIKYLSLTQEERDLAIAETIHAREVEAFHYALNAQNYTDLLSSEDMTALPKDWPENLKPLQNKTRDEIIKATSTKEDRETALALAHRDKLAALLASEQHELAKVEKYHAQAVAALPEERREAALAAAKAKRDGA